MAPEPEDNAPIPGTLPEEEEQGTAEGHLIARRRPDGRRIDEVGDPVPIERHPHHGA